MVTEICILTDVAGMWFPKCKERATTYTGQLLIACVALSLTQGYLTFGLVDVTVDVDRPSEVIISPIPKVSRKRLYIYFADRG